MMKSRENAKIKRFFGIFPAFSAGKIGLSKIGLPHILGIVILDQCAKFHEKVSNAAGELQEIPFFRRKSAVPVIFTKSRLLKSVLLTIEPFLMVDIVINNVFFVKKQRNRWNKCAKFQEKI